MAKLRAARNIMGEKLPSRRCPSRHRKVRLLSSSVGSHNRWCAECGALKLSYWGRWQYPQARRGR